MPDKFPHILLSDESHSESWKLSHLALGLHTLSCGSEESSSLIYAFSSQPTEPHNYHRNVKPEVRGQPAGMMVAQPNTVVGSRIFQVGCPY